MLQQIRHLLELGDDPGEVKRVGTQPREHSDVTLRRRRALLVVHRERQLATARQPAGAVLDDLPGSIPFQDLEPEGEADLIISRLELRCVAETGNGDASDGNRIVDDVGEHRIFAGSGENAHGEDGAGGIFGACKREKVGDVGRGIAN